MSVPGLPRRRHRIKQRRHPHSRVCISRYLTRARVSAPYLYPYPYLYLYPYLYFYFHPYLSYRITQSAIHDGAHRNRRWWTLELIASRSHSPDHTIYHQTT